PVAGTYMAGWNLANDFINMYQGFGGAFFKEGSAETAINGPEGLAALEMMKKLSGYMNPDFLTHDSNALQAEWKAGNVALANFWGSRAINLTAAEGAAPEVYQNTRVGAPMTVGGGNVPAASLWWDGWTVAKNISDADAAATFIALKHGSGPALLNDTTMSQAVWMIPGFKPGPANEGVMAAMAMGTRPYPMRPYMGLLHTALGDNLPNFFKGSASAAETLAAVEAAYTAAAKEKGFLN
ncbi:MAG: extracellular solute-binding protein, partial [Gemmobacter sp.]